jgi:uncharacterized membrane protein YphA (DoxX/SURF4 family)
MAVSAATADVVLLLGRVLFGGVLAFMGLNHFMQTDAMTGYADAKGIPAARLSVLGSGLVLVASGLGIVVGAFPLLAALGLAVFFVATTPTMHDFWSFEGEEQQQEMTQFLKNAALLGGSLAFIALSSETWAYSLGIGF